MELLHLAVLVAVLVQAQSEVSVQAPGNVEVKEGEEAILRCTTPSDILFCTFTSPEGKTMNMKKGLAYGDNGRIEFHGEDETKECGLRIIDVKEKDNGEWKCLLTASIDGVGKTGEETATVTVIKPPTRVHIEGIEDPQVILTYPQDSEKQFKCIAEGGRPAPTFSWQLDDEKYMGQAVDVEPVVATDGTTTQAQMLTYATKPEDNGKTLTCIVNHPGYSQEATDSKSNTADLSLDVKYAPIKAVEDNSFYGMKIGEAFPVLMNFKSHPAPTDVYWEMYDGTKVAQESETEDKRFKADALVEGPSGGLFTAKLTISSVVQEDTDKTGKLIVTNSEGTTEYKFSMGLGEKKAIAPAVSDTEGVPSPKEAGSGPVVAIVIVALIIVIVIVVAVIARAQGMLCFAASTSQAEDTEKAVEKEEGDTESAEHADGAKDEQDGNKEDEEALTSINNTNSSKKSVSSRVTSLFSAMRKSVGSKKEKLVENDSEVQLQEQNSTENDDAEKKDDSIVYADLDKTAMSEGTRPNISMENEKSEYAEIKPQENNE